MPSLPKVSVSNAVVDKLSKLDSGLKGHLCGYFHEGTLLVLEIIVPHTKQQNDCSDFLNSIPSEIQVCGAFMIGEKVEETQAYFLERDQNMQSGEAALLLTCMKNDLQSHFIVNGTVTKVPHSTVTNAHIASTLVCFRTKSEFLISGEYTQHGIKQSLEDIKKKLSAEDAAFLINKNLLIAGPDGDRISGMSGITVDQRVKDLFDSQSEQDNIGFDVLPVLMHLKQTKEHDELKSQCTAPLIRHVRRSFESARIVVRIDALALVHRNAKLVTLYNILANSFLRSLALVEASLLKQIDTGKQHAVSSPEMYHFLPAQSSIFISVVYPKDCNDADLKTQREQMHKYFGFGLDQPLFRRSQAYKFPGERSANGPLINPHEGLNSGVKGGQSSIVKGNYSYYHYMQDRFDDNGWGCAYRSLQTIVSWFRLQGYTEVNVPTHKQIQECLVKIGDKPASFVGSRQWIGSTEVSFVLETLLGVTCRILTASTGEEVGSLGSELSYHFQTHGTPIMIGGGVLAHTIIGVDYNRSTGDIKFLILDPHFTGGEDLGIITGKGWVGWKDSKFWTKNAFYNLCLPLRPIGDI